MELINKNHKDISEKTRARLEPFFKIRDDESLAFSAGAVILYGLNPGLYVHFRNDEFKWYFYCNSDPDGFKLSPASGGRGRNATLICNKSLVNLIKKRTRVSIGTRFPVTMTKAKLNGDRLMEINFNKPLETPTYSKAVVIENPPPKQLDKNLLR